MTEAPTCSAGKKSSGGWLEKKGQEAHLPSRVIRAASADGFEGRRARREILVMTFITFDTLKYFKAQHIFRVLFYSFHSSLTCIILLMQKKGMSKDWAKYAQERLL